MWRFSFFLLLFPAQISFSTGNQIIFWNVGQGQWITAIHDNSCFHFDVGGEFINSRKISETCKAKQNVIFFSHWDWDHIGLTKYLKNSVKNLCIAIPPQGNAKRYKKALVAQLPLCNVKILRIKKLEFKYLNPKTDNDLSQIFIFQEKLLIPGDSTKKMEKIWARYLPPNMRWLSVSHHGSRTSTSEAFLSQLKISQALVSARKKVYGHPHPEVLQRLKIHGVPTLLTEDWGNIKILTH